jgi:hypothetical protein
VVDVPHQSINTIAANSVISDCASHASTKPEQQRPTLTDKGIRS